MADAVLVSPAVRIVLVEGLYLLHDDHGWQHAHLFDENWFLDVPMEVAMERLAVNDRLNAEIVLRSRDRANWLVQNDTTA